MSSMMALQDRLGRNIVFGLALRLAGDTDRRDAIIAAAQSSGAVVSDFELDGVDENTDLLYNLTLFTTGDEQFAASRDAVAAIADVTIDEEIDFAMESHRGGPIETVAKGSIDSNTDLRIIYTPGVARVCKAIEADPSLAKEYTGIANRVAIVTNGTAILGLGDIGPVAGMPVMEGKSAIFAEFTGISADAILVDTKDPKEFIKACQLIAPSFGAIQVEDVAAPECFEITRTLDETLPIPVFHDDQHGTATIVLAGLYSAAKLTGKDITTLKVAMCGAGAAGTAISDLLQRAGVADVILCDSVGAIYRGRTERMNPEKDALAERTNKDNVSGSLADIMVGADVFIGCSLPNLVSQDMVRSMNAEPIIFPLANPVSEISKPDALAAGAAVYADGRTMNNALAYPGIFRGALDCNCTTITFEMMMAAAEALADITPEGDLLPEMMDLATHSTVARAVMDACKE
jgi:malate dehydrogenase (oxaloacetate-decarboxylating)